MLVHFPRITTDGLVLCLDAGNPLSYPGTGSTWTDLSGNGNNGFIDNGAAYNANSGGNIAFDGIDDNINFQQISNSINTIYTNNTFTYSLWFKYNTYTAYQGIGGIARNDNNAIMSFAYRVQGEGHIVFFDGRFGGIRRIIPIIQTVDIEKYLNKFLNITSTYDGSIFQAYLNGTVVSGDNFSSQIDDFTQKIFRLGWDGGYGFFNGNIAQCSLYNIPLSPDQVQKNYLATKGRYGL